MFSLTDSNIDQLIEKILQKKKAIPSKAAVFFADFDGTLIDGDITEGQPSFAHAPSSTVYKGLAEICFQGDFANYAEEYRKFISHHRERESLIHLAREFSYLEVKKENELKQLAHKHFEQILKFHFFDSALKILQELKRSMVKVFVISASPHLFVQSASPFLDLPAEQLSGIDMNDFDRPPFIVNYAEGKVKRMELILKNLGNDSLVLGAMGNSWVSDLPMLEHAIQHYGGVGIMVNGEERQTRWSMEHFIQVKFQKLNNSRINY